MSIDTGYIPTSHQLLKTKKMPPPRTRYTAIHAHLGFGTSPEGKILPVQSFKLHFGMKLEGALASRRKSLNDIRCEKDAAWLAREWRAITNPLYYPMRPPQQTKFRVAACSRPPLLLWGWEKSMRFLPSISSARQRKYRKGTIQEYTFTRDRLAWLQFVDRKRNLGRAGYYVLKYVIFIAVAGVFMRASELRSSRGPRESCSCLLSIGCFCSLWTFFWCNNNKARLFFLWLFDYKYPAVIYIRRVQGSVRCGMLLK